MNKTEFIEFLKSKSGGFNSCWKQLYNNSDDYWYYYKPGIDWLEDNMDLTKTDVIKIEYNRSFFEDGDILITTYDDFIKDSKY